LANEEEGAIEEFLGDQPRSAQFRQWRLTLEARARRLRQEVESARPEQRSGLKARLAELDKQIAALEQEELITEFVEDSVRATLAMGSILEGQRWEE
jgi:hypothetical protein